MKILFEIEKNLSAQCWKPTYNVQEKPTAENTEEDLEMWNPEMEFILQMLDNIY